MIATTLGARVFAEQIALARGTISSSGYAERVYAALLGKVLGVYIGRPFEGWDYARITSRFGEIDRYVAEELGKPILVTDDDIAGTMTFVRAAEDSGRGYETESGDIADGWLNYLVEGRSVLWWGGMGNSTEHTAYLRLKAGHRPPESGSAGLNGRVVSEQIGAQIFIDGWGLIAPGAPHLAAELARRAAIVSHDGEAVFGAQAVAAMEAAAFTTSDVDEIIDAGLSTIPDDCLIAKLAADVRLWHSKYPDWRATRELIDEHYGYHRYGGGCHMIPNHGLILLAMLYSQGDFGRAMAIVNTSGWDTDCNSGNVGCLLGLMSGLDSIDAGYDWRGPIADRIYVPTADAGDGISDVATETRRIVKIATEAAGLPPGDAGRPRFTFDFPGSLQGFQLTGNGTLVNELLPAPEVAAHSDDARTPRRGLRVVGGGVAEVSTPTFIPPEGQHFASYPLDASPTIYSGQTLELAYVIAGSLLGNDARDVVVTPLVRYYNSADEVETIFGQPNAASTGDHRVSWTLPDLDGRPICEVGARVEGSNGRFYLDSVGWTGTPTVNFVRPAGNGEMWRRAWVSESDFRHPDPEDGIRLISNGERRLAITGTAEWSDYAVEARVTPHAVEAFGLAARVQGLRRYYLLQLDANGEAALIRRRGEQDRVVGRAELAWQPGREVVMRLEVSGSLTTAWVDGVPVAQFDDPSPDLDHGGIALACIAGRIDCSAVRVTPVEAGAATKS